MTNTKALEKLLKEISNAQFCEGGFDENELIKAINDYVSTQLADAQEQLAAEQAMADRLAVALSYIVNSSVKEMQALDMTMTEIASQTPIMLAHDAYSAYEAHQSTRQPTQDKGE